MMVDPKEELIDFGVKTVKAMGEELSFLLHPATDAVTWYNDTKDYIDVKTYDEKDAVRWVPYETRKIAPKQAVKLSARGNLIHIFVESTGATYDCKCGHSYLFDGTNVHLKKQAVRK
jgi:hypothetical protein